MVKSEEGIRHSSAPRVRPCRPPSNACITSITPAKSAVARRHLRARSRPPN